MKIRFLSLATALAAVMIVTPARAAFHLWSIREVYSDSSGTLQFIELFDSFGGQNFTGGQGINVSSLDGTINHSFTLSSNMPPDTFNHAILLGTAGVQAAGAPAPNFILPNNFLFTAGGTISFFGFNGGTYTALPTGGSLSRDWNSGTDVANSPQNFAGAIGSVTAPEPSSAALMAVAGLGLWFARRAFRRM